MERLKKIINKKNTIRTIAYARVNLIGEHTDYTGGYVLPILLKLRTKIYISTNKKINKVFSNIYNETKSFKSFNKSKNNDWLDYVKGCLKVIKSNYSLSDRFLNIFIVSNIPINRGISSSSALCVALLKGLNKFYKLNLDNKKIALLAQKVEKEFIGVTGGIMDQMISSTGILKKAFFLNCKNLNYEFIDLPKDYKFCLIDSNIQRNLRESSYNKRYNELKNAEKILNVKYLADSSLNDLNKQKFNNNIIKKRARHVITENARVLKAVNALKNNDMVHFGKLMNESYKSYSRDFNASNKEINLLIKRSLASGAIGARLTGGGFGGFTVSLIKKNELNNWKLKMSKYYNKEKFIL